MGWRHNSLILDKIFSNLELRDLKAVSEVCREWLEASAKAIAATSRLVVADPLPKESPDLLAALQRFYHIRELEMKLGSTPNWITSAPTDFPLMFASLTHLKFEYEPTEDTLRVINMFLGQLTKRCGSLKQLQICPNGDPSSDLRLTENDDLADSPFEVHPNLTTLTLPVGPNSGSGIDFQFLRSLTHLKKLALLKFHIRGSSGSEVDGGPAVSYVHRQLAGFRRHFPAEAKISNLEMHLKLEIERNQMQRLDHIALVSALRSIKPDTCTIHIDPLESNACPESHLRQWRYVIFRLLRIMPLKKVNVFYSLPSKYFNHQTLNSSAAWVLVSILRHYRLPLHNAHVLLRVDLCWEDSGAGSPFSSFIEMECSAFGAPLIFRQGPVGEFEANFRKFIHTALNHWSLCIRELPVPNYNTLRKYSFDENREIVKQQQFYPGGRRNDNDDFAGPGRQVVYSPGYDGPALREWKETNFRVLDSFNLVHSQPSWIQRKISTNSLPSVSTLYVYSIE